MRVALMLFGIGSIATVSGLERVFVDMANAFADRGHEVWAVWNDEPGTVPFYPFGPKVRQVNLGLGKIKPPLSLKIQRELNKAFRREVPNKVDAYKTEQLAAALRKQIDVEAADCFVCYEFNSLMVANAVSEGKIPVAVMVHNSVENQIGKLTALQRKEAGKADVYQVLMPGYVKQAEALLDTRIVYIPNVVPQIAESGRADLGSDKDRYRIVHIGRIEGAQKRQLILVKAFARLAEKYPGWTVDLYGPVGDKEYKNGMDQFIKEHGLEERIQYHGITDEPLEVLRHGDIFPFPSAYEGFSLALTEAMGAGLPVIGFAGAASVGEMIVHEKTGLLAADEADFTRQLERLMKDRELRVRLGSNAREAMKEFSPDAVWGRWEALLEELCKKKPRPVKESPAG